LRHGICGEGVVDAVRLAGGLVIGLPVAASLAGSGLAIAAGIAVLLAVVATMLPDPYGLPAWRRDGVGPGWAELLISRVRMVALLPLIAVYAHAFAVYVVPDYPRLASAALVLLAVMLNNAAVWISQPIRMVMLGLLIVGTVVLTGSSFGPPPAVLAPGEAKPWWGIALAALALFALLVPRPGEMLWGRFVVTTLLGVAFGISTVHQLGTKLSLTFLNDLLIAAHGAPLRTVLVVLVGIATVTATIDTVADAELEFLDWQETVAIVATIALAVFATPVVLLITAGVAALGWAMFRFVIENLTLP
jgi:hypothetical protein